MVVPHLYQISPDGRGNRNDNDYVASYGNREVSKESTHGFLLRTFAFLAPLHKYSSLVLNMQFSTSTLFVNYLMSNFTESM